MEDTTLEERFGKVGLYITKVEEGKVTLNLDPVLAFIKEEVEKALEAVVPKFTDEEVLNYELVYKDCFQTLLKNIEEYKQKNL